MRLYQFTLPVRTNAGLSYELARKRFEAAALKEAGGYTAPQSFKRGVWRGSERDYKEEVAEYTVACELPVFKKLLAVAFEQFPDQEAIFTADLGPATIHARPAVEAAA